MLKTVVLPNIVVEILINSSKEQHLFEIELFCKIIHFKMYKLIKLSFYSPQIFEWWCIMISTKILNILFSIKDFGRIM